MWDGTSEDMQASSYVYKVEDGEGGKLSLSKVQRLATKGASSAEIFTPSHATRETMLLTNYMRCGPKQKALRNGKKNSFLLLYKVCGHARKNEVTCAFSGSSCFREPVSLESFRQFSRVDLVCVKYFGELRISSPCIQVCMNVFLNKQEKLADPHPSTYGILGSLRCVPGSL